MKPRFFKTPADFRAWLAKNHASADELLVGFYKKSSGRPSITWQESVDEALCAGWIDGVRRRIDDDSYSIRFTPRRKGSIWSLINTKRVAVLKADGRMFEAGLNAFAARDEKKTGVYSFERETATFPAAYLKRFRSNAKAWGFFDSQGAYYKRLAAYWVTSAKQEETRQRRLAQLIDLSARGEKPAEFQVQRPKSRNSE
ncbi:MAG TPA: YdeI/OmpD-associated family protein [Vicinamibacterales bacterium]|jgi:uncharacterized protein YdeI (YjbR/CyaY-like superfamily)